MIIKGYWHVFLINHWYSIVTDQLRIMINSGLYDACEEIDIGCLGPDTERALLQRLIVDQYPKLKIKYYSQQADEFEFPTLKLLQTASHTGERFLGFYIHTKAVTNPSDTIQNHWRAWLNEAILNRWREHHDRVIVSYDVSSVNHCLPPQHPEHFSGNFWWFNSDYIDHLPPISGLEQCNRWQAEQWICRGHGRFYAKNFVEPGRDVFKIQL
jgi:hypothetical protein